ncbi:trypsin-like peptidase domain-containing protein [Roseibium sp.]|uniref:trypsin-like peptidase domain-containing protein n=1 Tax=Roseibium sp. TaxID=1936156 RepID=UPI003D0A7DF9
MARFISCLLAAIAAALLAGAPAKASPAVALEHVVSVLPVWPGHQQGGAGARPGRAPEGSGVVIREGIIATAWHVIEPATRIDVRLSDGRILPARLLAQDTSTDIALLRIDEPIKPIEIAETTAIAQPVCAIGNAFGLGLSVTCGVVSALTVSNAGFNTVEDFVQTDAAANPGSSGGALVDEDGRLVGMVSAIFASDADANIGVNFAVSSALLQRVADALITDGVVSYPEPGWSLRRASRAQLAVIAAPVVGSVDSGSPADRAGLKVGDQIVTVGARRVLTPRDATAALAILPHTTDQISVTLRRSGETKTVSLSFAKETEQVASQSETVQDPDCPHPEDVCQMRQIVFPVSSFDPVGSATRIADDLLVTNRHVVGNSKTATVHTPSGPKTASVVPSGYRGDLVLLQMEGLPDDTPIPALNAASERSFDDRVSFYAIGADIARRQVRVFDPGELLSPPAEDGVFARLHVTAQMQPGVSGGGLVDAAGTLIGIAVGGGDGRFEAIPLADVKKLLELRADPQAEQVTEALGKVFEECAVLLDAPEAGKPGLPDDRNLTTICSEAANHGQLLKAGRILAQAGQFDDAIRMHGQAVEQVPNSINSRMSLLVSLQLGGRFAEMTGHARKLMELAPNDPQALRFSIQSGVWGGDLKLAEDGYAALLKADPRQAQAARRFIDAAPPAPPRR